MIWVMRARETWGRRARAAESATAERLARRTRMPCERREVSLGNSGGGATFAFRDYLRLAEGLSRVEETPARS